MVFNITTINYYNNYQTPPPLHQETHILRNTVPPIVHFLSLFAQPQLCMLNCSRSGCLFGSLGRAGLSHLHKFFLNLYIEKLIRPEYPGQGYVSFTRTSLSTDKHLDYFNTRYISTADSVVMKFKLDSPGDLIAI